METLAKFGAQWGGPKNFWYSRPSAQQPPSDIGCSAKVVVQVEVLGLDAFCSQVVVPLQIARLAEELRAKEGEKDALLVQLTSLQASLIDATRAGQEVAGDVAEMRGLLEQRNRQLQTVQERLESLQDKLGTVNRSVTDASGAANDASKKVQPGLNDVIKLTEQISASSSASRAN